jgi:hypothetical protein
MKLQIKNYEDLVKAFSQLKEKGFPKPYILTTEPVIEKRTGKQLRAYWRLINVVKNFMNHDCGNNFTAEHVSHWFKLKSGFFVIHENEKLPKSISDNSDCKREDMINILENILDFGRTFDIKDCFLMNDEWEEILRNYK